MKAELAWAAGLFDGEGCVAITRQKPVGNKSPQYRLVLKLAMCSKEAVLRFGGIIKYGSLSVYKAGKRTSAAYVWTISCRQAQCALKVLRPFLIAKAKETNVVLEFCSLPDGRKGAKGGHGCQKLDKALLRKRHELYLRCRRLKSRWRFRVKRRVVRA